MEDDIDLFDFVFNYMQEINKIQEKFIPQIMNEDNDSAVIFANFKNEVDKIHAGYLTNRKRSYCYGIDCPPKYSLVHQGCRHTVEINKNKAIVTIYTDTQVNGGVDFQFKLILSKGQWLINSWKRRYHSSDRTIEYKWY